MRAIRWWYLLGALIVACGAFLLLGVGSVQTWLIVELRIYRLLGLIVVGTAVGVSTLIFQTLTQNNILTPSILGFDALFILLQTMLLMALGNATYVGLNIYLKFALELAVMCAASLLLFKTLRFQREADLVRMILVGVIFGVLFRSLSAFLQRLLNPDEYLILQSGMFARFNTINEQLIAVTAVVVVVSLAVVWHKRYQLDILMLGRERAIALGINYQRLSNQILIIVALLVASSTALVGPISFFGLLVCAVVNRMVWHFHHQVRIVAVVLVSIIVLVVGQTVFEHLLGLKATLSVVIDFVGGMVFLYLVFRKFAPKI